MAFQLAFVGENIFLPALKAGVVFGVRGSAASENSVANRTVRCSCPRVAPKPSRLASKVSGIYVRAGSCR